MILGCVAAAALGLGVAVLLGVFWTPGDHWPFTAPTTTSTSIATIYPVDVADQTVATGCNTVGRLASDFVHDQSKGFPVTFSTSGALRDVERIPRLPAVPLQYPPIVSAAKVFSATLEDNAGSEHWRPVRTALTVLAAQCHHSLP